MPDASRDVFDTGTLPALLAARARQVSDRRLALDAGVGLVASVGALIFRPPLWLPLASLAASLAMFGIWGILDREVSDTVAAGRTSNRLLTLARAAVATAGALCGVLGALTLFFATLGTWIS